MPLENGHAQGVYASEAKVEERVPMALENLQVLEGRVDEVLTRHASICAERDRLRQALAESEARAADMAARLEAVEKERTQIRARVESILGRLEGLDLS